MRCESETGDIGAIVFPESRGKCPSSLPASLFLVRSGAWSFGSHLGLMRFVEQIVDTGDDIPDG